MDLHYLVLNITLKAYAMAMVIFVNSHKNAGYEARTKKPP
jgi:hypothetical protein